MNVLKDIRGWYGWLVSLALVLWRQLSFGIVDGKFLTQTKWNAKQRPDNPQVIDHRPKRCLDRGMKASFKTTTQKDENPLLYRQKFQTEGRGV